MNRFAFILRSVFISLTMISALILCALRFDAENIIFLLSTLVFIGSGTLFLIISIISLVVRIIKRARMDERSRMLDSFSSVLVHLNYGYILSFFRRISFWGTIMLVVNLNFFELNSTMLIGGPYSNDFFLAIYHGFLLWSLLSIFITFFLSIIYWAIYMPHYGDGAYNMLQYVGKMILGDIIAPYQIIKSYLNDKTSSNFFKFIVMVIFAIVNIIALVKSV